MPRFYIRRKVRKLVDELPVPTPWDLDRFVDGLGRARGKRIELAGMPGVGLHAVTFLGSWVDMIAFDMTATPVQIERSVLHEIGHLLFGHPSRSPTELTESGFDRYPAGYEEEAEAFAHHVLCFVAVSHGPLPPASRAAAAFDPEIPPNALMDQHRSPRLGLRAARLPPRPVPRT